MPKITVLPNEELCPQGVTFEAQKGETVAKALLARFRTPANSTAPAPPAT